MMKHERLSQQEEHQRRELDDALRGNLKWPPREETRAEPEKPEPLWDAGDELRWREQMRRRG